KAILGYQPDADFGRLFVFADVLHPQDKGRMIEAVKAHLKQRAAFDCEFRLRTQDNDYVWVHGCGQAMWNDEGRATRFAGSITDITLQRTTKSALEHSEAHYRT